jgi:cell division protease FtsH
MKDEDRRARRLAFAGLGLLALGTLYSLLAGPRADHALEIPYASFRERLKGQQVAAVTLGATRVSGTLKKGEATDPERFYTVLPPGGDPRLLASLEEAGVVYKALEGPSGWVAVLAWLLPFAGIGALWFLLPRLGRGTRTASALGRSRASQVDPGRVALTYDDVGGADEAIVELREIAEFLRAPGRFARLGAHVPTGILIVGPPGTGKTLLAKATAAEAGVPFFETSGSEFVELFVGVGAARVRDLFARARRAAPAIIFVDELDSIGQTRGGVGRLLGSEERDQTLNQLLAEIDGFRSAGGRPVVVIAASNRPEVLDPALLRPGRFDRHIVVGHPYLAGRLRILQIHARGVTLDPDVDLARIARLTPGLSGADLATIVNEAALLAGRRNGDSVGLRDFEQSLLRTVAGVENRAQVLSERERRTVACHESGHALVAALLPGADPVARVSIVPRSHGSLGHTFQMPGTDRTVLTVAELADHLAVLLGGRAAEAVALGTASTGGAEDIDQATVLAHRMVAEYGMSERLGCVRYGGSNVTEREGRRPLDGGTSSDARNAVDDEVRRILAEQYERAHGILARHHEALSRLTENLLRAETLDGEAVAQALLPVPLPVALAASTAPR